MTDQQIIQLIRTEKTQKALNVLYKHFPIIKSLITRNGGNAQDAEDIFQEALIIFIRNARPYDFQLTSQLSTYLYGICRFLWRDELRKRKQIDSVQLDDSLVSPELSNISEIIEEDRRAKTAESILNGLGERCRELLLLFYNGGLRLKDIARKMGYATENAAKNQKYKCLEHARNQLRPVKENISIN